MNAVQTQLFEPSANLNAFSVSVTHDSQLVRQLVRQWHSSNKPPVGWRVAFLLHDGAAIIGVSTFGRPVARMEDQVHTLEHTRMALAPSAPRNAGTFFMAHCRVWIRENMPEIKRLISYVSQLRHTGIVYRGDNWRLVYERHKDNSMWTNRPGRIDSKALLRAKFEREP